MRLRLKLKLISRAKNFTVLACLFLIASCDFSPRLYKEILQAQKLISERKYSEAILKYESIVKKNSGNEIKIKIYYQLGELYSIHIGNYKKATHYYNLIKKNSNDPLWLIKAEEKLGEINYSFLKNYSAALENYINLESFEPRLSLYDLYDYRVGMTYSKMNQVIKAESIFSRISLNKKHKYYLKAQFQLGLMAFQSQKWQTAINYWSSYIQKETRKDSVVQAKFLMANAYETMELLKKAYNIYYSILGEYPNTKVVNNRLESIYKRRVSRKR